MTDLDAWPMKYNRYICTADRPMPHPAPKGPWLHEDAEEGEQRDGWPGGDLVRMNCPHCGIIWERELPQ